MQFIWKTSKQSDVQTIYPAKHAKTKTKLIICGYFRRYNANPINVMLIVENYYFNDSISFNDDQKTVLFSRQSINPYKSYIITIKMNFNNVKLPFALTKRTKTSTTGKTSRHSSNNFINYASDFEMGILSVKSIYQNQESQYYNPIESKFDSNQTTTAKQDINDVSSDNSNNINNNKQESKHPTDDAISIANESTSIGNMTDSKMDSGEMDSRLTNSSKHVSPFNESKHISENILSEISHKIHKNPHIGDGFEYEHRRMGSRYFYQPFMKQVSKHENLSLWVENGYDHSDSIILQGSMHLHGIMSILYNHNYNYNRNSISPLKYDVDFEFNWNCCAGWLRPVFNYGNNLNFCYDHYSRNNDHDHFCKRASQSMKQMKSFADIDGGNDKDNDNINVIKDEFEINVIIIPFCCFQEQCKNILGLSNATVNDIDTSFCTTIFGESNGNHSSNESVIMLFCGSRSQMPFFNCKQNFNYNYNRFDIDMLQLMNILVKNKESTNKSCCSVAVCPAENDWSVVQLCIARQG